MEILIKRLGREILCMIVFAIAGVDLRAQDPQLGANLPESFLPQLNDLLKAAVAQSPTLLAANLDLALNKAYALGDASQRLPQAFANGNFGYSSTRTTGGVPQNATGLYYGFGVNQAVYHWGMIKAQNEIGKLRVSIANHSLKESYRNLTLSVRSQYLILIQKKKQVRNSVDSLRRTESYVKALEQQFKAGAIAQSQLSEPTMRMEEQRLANDRMYEDYEVSKSVLAQTCGVKNIADAQIADDIPPASAKLEDLDQALESSVAFDAANTEQGKILTDTIRSLGYELAIAKKRMYPMFGISAGISQNNNTSISPTVDHSVYQYTVIQEYANIGFTWNLFDGFASKAAKQQGLIRKRQAEMNLETYKKKATNQIETLRKQVLFSLRASKLSDARINSSLGFVGKTKEDVKLGIVPQDTLDAALQNQNEMEAANFGARIDFYNKLAEFLSTLGIDPAMQNLNPRVSSHGNP